VYKKDQAAAAEKIRRAKLRPILQDSNVQQ